MLESLFNKVAGLQVCNFIKGDSTTDFFCEYYKIFKNTYFEEHLGTAVSGLYLSRKSKPRSVEVNQLQFLRPTTI